MTRIAVIINGCLRFFSEDNVKLINSITDKCDVFIKTYKDDEKYLEYLNYKKNLTFIDKNKVTVNHSFLQFYSLQETLKEYDFTAYDVIIKIRTDTDFWFSSIYDIISQTKIEDNIIYMASDVLFYAKSNHFINVFKNIYDYFININAHNSDREHRAILPNYENLSKSILNTNGSFNTKWRRMLFPKFLNIFPITSDSEIIKILKNNKEVLIKERENTKSFNNYKRIIDVRVSDVFCSERWFVQFVINKSIFHPSDLKVTLKRRKDRLSYYNPWNPIKKTKKVALCLRGNVARFGWPHKYTFENCEHNGRFVDVNAAFNSLKIHLLNNSKNQNYHFDTYIHSWCLEKENELIKLYNPKKYLFEDNNIYSDEINRRCIDEKDFGGISQSLSMKKSINLMYSSNIEYDIVILYRPDILLYKDFDLDKYDSNVITVNGHPNCHGDFHFVMSYSNALKFRGLYDSALTGNKHLAHIWICNFIRNILKITLTSDDIEPGKHQEVLRKIRMAANKYNINYDFFKKYHLKRQDF